MWRQENYAKLSPEVYVSCDGLSDVLNRVYGHSCTTSTHCRQAYGGKSYGCVRRCCRRCDVENPLSINTTFPNGLALIRNDVTSSQIYQGEVIAVRIEIMREYSAVDSTRFEATETRSPPLYRGSRYVGIQCGACGRLRRCCLAVIVQESVSMANILDLKCFGGCSSPKTNH